MATAMIANPNKATKGIVANERLPEEASLLTPRIGPPDVTCKYSMYELWCLRKKYDVHLARQHVCWRKAVMI